MFKKLFLTIVIIFSLSMIFAGLSFAGPLDNWHVRNFVPGGYRLYSVAYGNGTFVAVGSGGTILSSPDGTTWTLRTSGTSVWLSGVAFGNGLFVAVGESGTILTSPDGANWTARTSGTGLSLDSVACGNGIFVVVSGRTTNLTSTDGVNWTVRNSPEMDRVAFGDGRFVALGIGSSYCESQDGANWTFKIVYLNPQTDYSGILVHNGTYVLVGANLAPWFVPSPVFERILTSADGTNWIETFNGRSSGMFHGITHGNGFFVAVGPPGALNYSPDGYSWTATQTPASDWLNAVTYGNRTFVAVGENGLIIQSDPMIEAVNVPALSEWGMILLAMSCSLAAIRSFAKSGE